MILLDRHNPDHVTSWQDIEATLVDPSRQMRILSGIARPEFAVNDDGRVYPEQCIVSLGITLPDFIQATCQVGLASIANDNTAFTFALDDCWVAPDDSGELKLTVNLGARGEKTRLARFGFQIVALYGARITGISGQIRWARSLLDPTPLAHLRKAPHQAPLDVPSVVRVHAQVLLAPGPADPRPGSIAGPAPNQMDLGYVTPSGDVHAEGDDFWVAYAFEHLPLGVPLRIFGTDVSPRFGTAADVEHISGPDPATLTPAHLSDRVDFRIVRHQGPS